jgi:hypothetical protein
VKKLMTGAMVLFLAPVIIPVLLYMGFMFMVHSFKSDENGG